MLADTISGFDSLLQNRLKAHAAQHSQAWETERDARLQMEARLTAALDERLSIFSNNQSILTTATLDERLGEEAGKADDRMKATAETAGKAFLAACVARVDDSAEELREEMQSISRRGTSEEAVEGASAAVGDASRSHLSGRLQQVESDLQGMKEEKAWHAEVREGSSEELKHKLDALEVLAFALKEQEETTAEARQVWESGMEERVQELRIGADRDRRNSLSSMASKEEASDSPSKEGLNELKSNLSSRLRDAVKLMESRVGAIEAKVLRPTTM